MRIVTESINTIPSGTGDKPSGFDQYAHIEDAYKHSTNTSTYGHIVLQRNKSSYGELLFTTPQVNPYAHIKNVTVTSRFGFKSGSRMTNAWYEVYMNGELKGARNSINITKGGNQLYTLSLNNISPSDINNVRVRIGGTNDNSALSIGVTERRSIFVYGIDIDIEYDLVYYQISTNMVNCKETLHISNINISSLPTVIPDLNALPIGTEKMFAICGTSKDTGVFGSNGNTWVLEKYGANDFSVYGTANLTNESIAQNEQIIYRKVVGYMANGDVMSFNFKRVDGGFTIQNRDGYYLSRNGWSTVPVIFELRNIGCESSSTSLVNTINNPLLANIFIDGVYLRWDDTEPTWRDATSSFENWLLYEVTYDENKIIEGVEHTTVKTAFSKDGSGNILYSCKVDGVDTFPQIAYDGNPLLLFNDITSDHTVNIAYTPHKILQKRDNKWNDTKAIYQYIINGWKHMPLKNFIDFKNRTLLEIPYSLFYKKPLTAPSIWIKNAKLGHSTGAEEATNGSILSDYIPVDRANSYIMSASHFNNNDHSIYAILMYAFDANKNYLGRVPGMSYDIRNNYPVYCYFDSPNGYNGGLDSTKPVTTFDTHYEDIDVTRYIFDNSGTTDCEDTSHNNKSYTGDISYIRIRINTVSTSEYVKDSIIEEEWVKLYVAENAIYENMGANDTLVGEIINNSIVLSNNMPNEHYSLAFENDKNVMINGWGKFETSNSVINGLIDENIAPYVASKIGVYDKQGERQGYVDIEKIKPVFGKRLYRFGIVSDVHYNDNDDNNIIQDDGSNYHSDLICAMRFFEEKEDIEFVCCGGDITTNYITQAKTYHDALKNYAPTTNVYTCKGNHDNAASYGNEALWKEYTYPTNNPFTTYFFNNADPTNIFAQSNGSSASYYFIRPYPQGQGQQDVFVFFSVDYNSNSANSKGTQYYNPNSITWLSAVLEKYKNNRVFLFTHLFFWKKAGNCNEYYYPGNHSSEYVLFGSQYDILNDLNNRYKNVIWFTGHSHYKWRYQLVDTLGTNGPQYRCNVCNFDTDTNSESAYNVHIPSLAVPLINSLKYQNDPGASECGVVDVYTDCVIVRGIRMDNTINQTYEYLREYVPMAQYRLGVSYNGSRIPKRFANGHKYVDLGLPSGTFWAECNVNATAPEETGDYFAWGEVETKDNFSWSTYRWGTSETALTKYNYSSTNGVVDNKYVLDLEDDVAHVVMGGSWHMPTTAQIQELVNYTTFESVVVNGVECFKLTSTINGKSLIIPNSGNKNNSDYILETRLPSNTLEVNYPRSAYALYLSNSEAKVNAQYRYRGTCVRGVL